MQAGERDLGRPRQVEVVVLQRVDVRALRREEAGSDHRLLPDEHRGQHRREARLGRVLDRKAVERQREQRRVADDVAEARSGQPGGALELEAPDLRCLPHLCERGRLTEAPQLHGVVLAGAVGCRFVGWVRYRGESLVALGFGRSELLLCHPQLFLHPLQLLELFRSRLALQLRRAA